MDIRLDKNKIYNLKVVKYKNISNKYFICYEILKKFNINSGIFSTKIYLNYKNKDFIIRFLKALKRGHVNNKISFDKTNCIIYVTIKTSNM